MQLYLDDDTAQSLLVKLLRKAGHDVQIPADVGRSGADDPVHLRHAIQTGRVAVSHNHKDFEQLHQLLEAGAGHHPGIIIVRKDNTRGDLKPAGIVAALQWFIASGDPISDQHVVINHYR